MGGGYDLVILHDALEHIPEKEQLMQKIGELMKKDGVLYMAFPAWQMPFGGHQQMAKNKILANFPYIHLLPRPLFSLIFRTLGETEAAVQYYFGLRDTGITIEQFERLAQRTGYKVIDRSPWFINPNYSVKFGLKPRKLSPLIARLPWIRNFFTTTCYYILKRE